MVKKIISLLSFLILLLLVNKAVFAETNFETSANVEYKVQESGLTLATETVTIKNLKSAFYAKKYVLNLQELTPKNIKAYDTGRLLNVKKEETENGVNLTVEFAEPAVGKNKSKTFVVTFEDETLSKKVGEIWEVSVPKLDNPELFKDYTVVLSVPKTFGDEAYVTPQPLTLKTNSLSSLYTFDKESLEKSGVSAGFGKFQVFKFSLTYHLKNTFAGPQDMEIAIPPDTSTQRVFYDSISPLPDKINEDDDGNWIGVYKLDGGKNIDITAKGTVQIFASPRKLLSNDSEIAQSSLQPSSYWQSDDPEIKKIASTLRSPEEIYNFVSKTLKYDKSRLSSDIVRMGAKAALENPGSALCTEFTDLFIALARAKGIPAREINGYAYSQDTSVEPLSLVTDVLHSWPEYWDDSKKLWIPIDPTWASTTGGVDFFNKFDLRHFAFVIHGKNPVTPYSAGSYKVGTSPEKDVSVTFGKLPEQKTSNLVISYEYKKGIQIFGKKMTIKIENKGNAASYDSTLNVSFGNQKLADVKEAVLPPFSSYLTTVNIPFGFLGVKMPDNIKVKADRAVINIPLDKTQIVINQLLVLFVLLMTGFCIYLVKVKHIHIINNLIRKKLYDLRIIRNSSK